VVHLVVELCCALASCYNRQRR